MASVCVFENLTLDIEQHGRVAILGPNGSGKTTLLKIIDRELYPVTKADSTLRILRDRVTPDQIAVAMETLTQLGPESLSKRPLQNLPSGQQRRCLLARALVHDPATLILDEPTSGLDFTASFDYLDRIRHLARDGRNIIILTQEILSAVYEIPIRVAVVDGYYLAYPAGPR